MATTGVAPPRGRQDGLRGVPGFADDHCDLVRALVEPPGQALLRVDVRDRLVLGWNSRVTYQTTGRTTSLLTSGGSTAGRGSHDADDRQLRLGFSASPSFIGLLPSVSIVELKETL